MNTVFSLLVGLSGFSGVPPLFLLHGDGGGTALGHLMELWSWEPPVLLGCAGLLVGYMAVQRFRLGRASLAFSLGVLVLLFALVSPLHVLGEHYLFSAHMVQHLLIALVVPPLLILGTPAWVFERLLRLPVLDRLERVLGRPLVAWWLAAVTMWVWHAPVLFNAALLNPGLHAAEHMAFLATGTLFWWPVLSPLPERRRVSVGGSMVYLFSQGITSCALGIMLTFATPGLYPAYVTPTDPYGMLAHLRYDLGLTPALDQQLGGVFMWVPGCLVYIGAVLAILGRWLSAPDIDDIVPANEAAATRKAAAPALKEEM